MDEELVQAQAYVRKLHAYLEPRMLRRMKAVCLAGQMPPKVGGEGSLRLAACCFGFDLCPGMLAQLPLEAHAYVGGAWRARCRPRRSEQPLHVLQLPASVVWLRR